MYKISACTVRDDECTKIQHMYITCTHMQLHDMYVRTGKMNMICVHIITLKIHNTHLHQMHANTPTHIHTHTHVRTHTFPGRISTLSRWSTRGWAVVHCTRTKTCVTLNRAYQAYKFVSTKTVEYSALSLIFVSKLSMHTVNFPAKNYDNIKTRLSPVL